MIYTASYIEPEPIPSSEHSGLIVTPPPTPPTPTRQILPLTQIRRDRKLQQRASGIDRPTVAEYQETLGELPPPKVKFDGTDYWLYDGYHTLSAALANGLTEIECEVTPGTFDDAEWESCAANKNHGLRRKLADKQKAVCTALRLKPEMSDRAIARHCGVGADMVGDWRAILAGDLPRRKRDPGVSPNGHTLEELIELYRPLGEFKPTGDSKFRYELVRSNGSNFFRGLDEAYLQFGELNRKYSYLAKNINAEATERPAEAVSGSVPFIYTPQADQRASGANLAATDAPSETAADVVEENQPVTAEVSDPTPDAIFASPKSPAIEHPAGVLASAKSHEHYTPEGIWQAGLKCFGIEEYDLDPASYAGSPIPCKRIFTKQEDGLKQIWEAEYLWSNFPYSDLSEEGRLISGVMEVWVSRLISAYDGGSVKNALTLTKCDCRTGWYHQLLDICTAFCQIKGAVKHGRPNGEESKNNGSFFGSTVFLLGGEIDRFYYAYSPLGKVCQVIEPGLFAIEE